MQGFWKGVAVAACLLAADAIASAGRVRASEASDIENVVRSPSFVKVTQPGVSLSPNARHVAFVLRPAPMSAGDLRQTVRTVFSRTGIHALGVNGIVMVADLQTQEQIAVSSPASSSFQPIWSPDGERLAFFSDEGGRAKVWIWNARTRQRTAAADVEARPLDTRSVFWLPDGRRLLVRLAPSNGTVQTEGELDAAPRDRKQAASPGDGLDVSVFESQPPEKKAGQPQVERPAIIDQLFFADLAIIDLQTRAVQRFVTDTAIRGFWPSPDGARVLFARPLGAVGGDSGRRLFDLYLTDPAARATATRVAENVRMSIFGASVSWSPRGDLVAFVTAEGLHTSHDRAASGESFLIDPQTGTVRPATRNPHPYFGDRYRPPVWSRDGHRLFFLAGNEVWALAVASGAVGRVGGFSDWTLLDIVRPRTADVAWDPGNQGEVRVLARHRESLDEALLSIRAGDAQPTVLWSGPKTTAYNVLFDADVAPDQERAVFLAQDRVTPEELWLFDRAQAEPRRITRVSRLPDQPDVARHLVIWRSPDNVVIKGLALVPATSSPGERIPFVVTFYPGSRCSDEINSFGLSTIKRPRIITDQGWGILCVDVPFTGRGLKRDVLHAVLPGVELIVSKGWADPDRLGIMGTSLGGYGVTLLLTEAARFAAGVVVSGFADPASWFGTFDEGSIHAASSILLDKGRIGTTPWDDPSRYQEASAIFRLDQLDTPLLILHGAKDGAVPVYLGEQLFANLKRLGKKATYVRYEREGHGIVDPSAEVDLWKRTTAFFETNFTRRVTQTPDSARRN